MHLSVTVQAVLTHDETPARKIRIAEIEQAAYMSATATATATVPTANPAMTLLAQLWTLAIE
jgi:hypothetical protein